MLKHIENYHFCKCDICDFEKVKRFLRYIDSDVIHLAAESHVDRSIEDPFSFAQTNVMGTLVYCKLQKNIGMEILPIIYFIMCLQTKYMVL